jgi:hypothetical protein
MRVQENETFQEPLNNLYKTKRHTKHWTPHTLWYAMVDGGENEWASCTHVEVVGRLAQWLGHVAIVACAAVDRLQSVQVGSVLLRGLDNGSGLLFKENVYGIVSQNECCQRESLERRVKV